MTSWCLNPDYQDSEAEREFCSIGAVFALEGDIVSSDTLSCVLRVSIDGKRYYVKRYFSNGKNIVRRWFGLRGLIGPQRIQTEWRNLLFFRRLGIPVATVVCYGLDRRFGYFIRGALVTEEVPDTMDLATMARTQDRRLRDRSWVAEVMHQVAHAARRLHDVGFAHNDLKWRNLLVNGGEKPTVHLIDCPSGSHWWEPFLQYRILKDLASLDIDAKRHLSRTQRLKFYLDYTGHSRLDARDKKRIRRIRALCAERE